MNTTRVNRFVIPTWVVMIGMAMPGWVRAEVSSREFKLPLQTAPFATRDDLKAVVLKYAEAQAVWAGQVTGTKVAGQVKRDKTRVVHYLDQPGECGLRAAGLILRVRANGERQVLTLKTRSADTESIQRMKLNEAEESAKLEEDISPPMETKVSRSVSRDVALPPADLDSLRQLFPALNGWPLAKGPLAVVGGTEIREETYDLPNIIFAGIKAKADVTLWYGAKDGVLRFAETSFRYAVPSAADQARQTADRAAKLFQAMQEGLWSAATENRQTKTDWIYDDAGKGFCLRANTKVISRG
ncbi:hypothetical protein [Chitinivorax sp. B]|uniref:hypothetical protein n=1 Tax=Chitinivorax sp. B TaxID=2502235 RepID=UPI0010F7D290|nr:hypothetical protein [Chitinivorax sp. B]